MYKLKLSVLLLCNLRQSPIILPMLSLASIRSGRGDSPPSLVNHLLPVGGMLMGRSDLLLQGRARERHDTYQLVFRFLVGTSRVLGLLVDATTTVDRD